MNSYFLMSSYSAFLFLPQAKVKDGVLFRSTYISSNFVPDFWKLFERAHSANYTGDALTNGYDAGLDRAFLLFSL